MKVNTGFQPLARQVLWVEGRERPEGLSFLVQIDKDHVNYGKAQVGGIPRLTDIRNDNLGNGRFELITGPKAMRQWAEQHDIFIPAGTAKPATPPTTTTTIKEVEVIYTVEPVQQRTVTYGAGEAIAGANAIATLIQQAINQAMNIDDIRALAEQKINDAVRNLMTPTIISVQQAPDQEPIPVGSVHKAFPMLLQAMSARSRSGRRLNICLVGPAGTGKSTAAEQAATALGLPFYPYSAIDSKFEIIGFRDAQGQVVRTPFREACEFGGVVLFDEMSASSANARLALNAILANRIASFPDGPMKLHEDCIILGGDNVIGGATAAYNGRHKPDASSIDRWIYLDWDIDTTLERVIAGNDSWTDIVAKVRSEVERQGIRDVLITPRSSETGAALLAQGMSIKDVARMTLKKNMSEEQWSAVCAKVAELR